MESGVHSSLHANYHHQRIYDKFNLKFNYPPPYKREIWHHEQANADIIKIVDLFPWEKAFRNDIIFSFQEMVKNIISNHISHETTFEDSNPPWITHYAFGDDAHEKENGHLTC